MKMITMVLLAVGCFLVMAIAEEDQRPYRVPVGEDGVQRVAIVGGDYYFRPAHIIVKMNIPVELSVRKDGWLVPHDFIIDAPEAGINIRENLAPEPKLITFIPKKAGSYLFYCDKKLLFLDSHRDKGMEGKLDVTE